MSSYRITNNKLDKNKVFILQKSEFEKRFDPEYYGHSFNQYDKILAKKPYKRFSQILKSINNGFDFRNYKENGTPFVKSLIPKYCVKKYTIKKRQYSTYQKGYFWLCNIIRQ